MVLVFELANRQTIVQQPRQQQTNHDPTTQFLLLFFFPLIIIIPKLRITIIKICDNQILIEGHY